MKIYISGAIADSPNFRLRFAEAAEQLAKIGVTPVNPLDVDDSHDGECKPGYAETGKGHTSACALKADIRTLLDCDAIAMLGDWRKSRGARVELTVARAIGLPVYYIQRDGLLLDAHTFNEPFSDAEDVGRV